MRTIHKTKAEPRTNIRRLWFGCLSLLFIIAFTAMAGSNAFSKISAGAKEVRSLVVWYVRNDQWRADARAYLTYAEYLLCPTSGIEYRLEFDEDDE